VPALVHDVGRRAWWPSALGRTDRGPGEPAQPAGTGSAGQSSSTRAIASDSDGVTESS